MQELRNSPAVLRGRCQGPAQCRAELFSAGFQLLPVWRLHQPSPEEGCAASGIFLVERETVFRPEWCGNLNNALVAKLKMKLNSYSILQKLSGSRQGKSPEHVVVCSGCSEEGLRAESARRGLEGVWCSSLSGKCV